MKIKHINEIKQDLENMDLNFISCSVDYWEGEIYIGHERGEDDQLLGISEPEITKYYLICRAEQEENYYNWWISIEGRNDYGKHIIAEEQTDFTVDIENVIGGVSFDGDMPMDFTERIENFINETNF